MKKSCLLKIKAKIYPNVIYSFIDHPERKPSLSIFFCGCPFRCKGCHNPELQDMNNSECKQYNVIEFYKYLCNSYLNDFVDYIDGIVFLGGEPTLYRDFIKELILLIDFNFLKNGVKDKVKFFDYVLYTGRQIEELPKSFVDLFTYIIDGRYIEDLKTGSFPASSNQRVFKTVLKGNQIFQEDVTSYFLSQK